VSKVRLGKAFREILGRREAREILGRREPQRQLLSARLQPAQQEQTPR
jgi:hypothetical protein